MLTTTAPNYWDIHNFLYADRNYLGGSNTIRHLDSDEKYGVHSMLVQFETQCDTHPLDLEPGSWSAEGHRKHPCGESVDIRRWLQ